MLRICDVCGVVDELGRNVISCTPAEAPPVNQQMLSAVLDNPDLDGATKAAIVADLSDNTLMLRHLPEAECIPFSEEG
jgi:hypothetical protein